MKTIYSLTLAAASVAALAGCGPPPPAKVEAKAEPAAKTMATPKPVPAAVNDDRIQDTFKKTYVYKTYLKDEKISVTSKDGLVALSGTVSEENHRAMAEDTLQALPGVKSVVNTIKVTGDQAAVNSDAWIASRIKATLKLHRNVSSLSTSVDVKDGAVTLRGQAGTEAQKELTAEYAKDVEGVKEVRNEMTVGTAPVGTTAASTTQSVGEAIDDASITTQVKLSLLYHRSTSAMKTKVSSKDGAVTVSGEAKNGAEKDLVSKLVADVNGVKSVMNNMTVAQP